MIDPKKILRFMESYFDVIKDIYLLQKENGFISINQLEKLSTNEIVEKLIEYSIVEERIGGDFILRESYFDFICALLDDYSLDMPQQIGKYHTSLSELFRELKMLSAKKEIIKTLEALEQEILRFESQLKRNIKKLIDETKIIKANNEKLTYAQKIKKASELSMIYLNPLNIILRDHSGSISYVIKSVIEETHVQKLTNSDANLKNIYTRVHTLFAQVKKEIFNENRLLINEVAPLLERIKTESQILTGFINYLADPSKYATPSILDKKATSVTYNHNAYYDARDIWDGYSDTFEDIIMDETNELESQWYYDEKRYTKQFIKSIPNDNYFDWVYKTLKEEIEIVDSKSFLQLSKLIVMSENLDIVYTKEREEILLEDVIFNVPVVQIKGVL